MSRLLSLADGSEINLHACCEHHPGMCCFGRCRRRTHPYAPALTSATPHRQPSVIDLNARTFGGNRGGSGEESLEFSRNCHSCVGPSSTFVEPAASPRSAFEIEMVPNTEAASEAPSVPPRPAQRALQPALDASVSHQCTACTDRQANSNILESLMRHPSRVRAETASVPERVQRGLRRSSMYQVSRSYCAEHRN